MTIWRITLLHLPHLHQDTQELVWSIILCVAVLALAVTWYAV